MLQTPITTSSSPVPEARPSARENAPAQRGTVRALRPSATLQRHCSTQGPVSPEQECDECRDRRRDIEESAGLAPGALAGQDLRAPQLQPRRPSAADPAAAGPAPQVALDALAGPSRPLAADIAEDLSAAFGHDLTGVRIHDGPDADAATTAVAATAYTAGSDIVFGRGQYRPDTADGRRLLAHELAHVVQQRSGLAADAGPPQVGAAESPLERQAERAAEEATGG